VGDTKALHEVFGAGDAIFAGEAFAGFEDGEEVVLHTEFAED
jgi:hypothetical protein